MARAPVKADFKGAQQKLRELSFLIPKKMHQVIDDQGRLVVEKCVSLMKPKSKEVMLKRIYGNIWAGHRSPQGGAKLKGWDKPVSKPVFYGAWKKHKRLALSQRLLTMDTRAKQFAIIQMSHRGFLAAGWLGDGNPLGAKRGISNEVSRHKKVGSFKRVKTIFVYRITITNLVSYAADNPATKRVLSAVMEGRKKQLTGLIRRIKRNLPTKYTT